MKYVSLDQVELHYSKQTEKEICFLDYPQTYSDHVQEIRIPKTLVKVAANTADDYLFFVPSWYYMKTLLNKMYAKTGPLPKHATEEEIKKTYTSFLNVAECEID